MIRETLSGVHFCVLRPHRNPWGSNLIIDTPADILCPRLATIRPPGVLFSVGVEATEHIYEANFLEHPCEPCSFFGQKPRTLLVGALVFHISLRMCDVPIATQPALFPIRLVRILACFLRHSFAWRSPLQLCREEIIMQKHI